MPALTLVNGLLRVDGCGGPLVVSDSGSNPCCCNEAEYTIEICNSNSVTDDDWRVELNGKNIGTHSAPGMILAGTVWRTHNDIEVGCGQVTYKTFSKNDLACENTILMTITALYNEANFGTVTVREWKRENNVFVENKVLLAGEYTGPSQIGFTNLFNFVGWQPCSFYSPGGNWCAASSWYFDAAFTRATNRIPTINDIVHIYGSMTSDGTCTAEAKAVYVY